jgi:adenosylmethionine-8-amino-7-oxononanoate aminotransferase
MDLVQADKEFIWHPFTPLAGAPVPIHISHGAGAWLFASDGRKFIDGISSWWVNLHGHAHPFINKKLAEQACLLEHVIFAGFTHTPARTLANQLLTLLPNHFSKIFYSDNGSTAVEVALKMAVQYWSNLGQPKTKIIALEGAYHGDTFGAMSVGARSLFTEPFQSLLFDVVHIPLPDNDNLSDCLQQLQSLLQPGDVAAFIFEPLVQGASGMRMYQPDHLDVLLSLVKSYGVLCIADEVMTGFYRTGKMFAMNYLQHTPDLVCLSKGLTGGYLPMGVTACSTQIFQAFNASGVHKTFYHGHSYTANPLACAVALASLELLKEPATLGQVRRIADAHALFIQSTQGHPAIRDIRCRGTILAIELNEGHSSYFNAISKEIYQLCLQQEVLLRPLGNVLYCMPPYCINETELQKIYTAMEKVLDYLSAD